MVLLIRKAIDRAVGILRYDPRIGPLWSKIQWWDDFVWEDYTTFGYRSEIEKYNCLSSLMETSWSVENGKILLPSSSKPLHPWHRLIYEQALKLNPPSVFECGFGGGDHLTNLSVLLPQAKISGADVSQNQAEYANERNGAHLRNARLLVRDITKEEAVDGLLNSAEFVYTQAVLMHIHGRDRHKTFMRNMGLISSRYVMLVENWLRHDFVRDLREIFPDNRLYLITGEHAAALLVDKQNALGYPVVESDKQIRRIIGHKQVMTCLTDSGPFVVGSYR